MRRKEAGFVAAQAAIFVGVIALVSLPVQSTNGVPQGLQLRVTLSSSSVQSHGAISARVEVFNTLDRNVSFSGLVQNQKISGWNGYDYLCGNPTSSVLGFALFRGHFAAGNISAAGQPLQLAPPEVVLCPFSPIARAVTFLPEGDHAVVTTDMASGPLTVSVNATTGYCNAQKFSGGGGDVTCPANLGLVGYWNDSVTAPGNLNFTSPAFVYFPPGEYTMEAADVWNQYVYATFVVQPTSASGQNAATGQTAVPGDYTVNGLTCPDPSHTSAEEVTLISQITESPRFQAATNGSRFVLGDFENLTDRIQTINGTTTRLPDALELVFYGYGSATTCVRGPGNYVDLFVDVPIENGIYNVTDMQIDAGIGPY